MDNYNNSPTFNLDFYDLYFGSWDLFNQEDQFCKREQEPAYQGMPVQAMDTPLSVYHSSSNIQRNNVKPLNLLHDYKIEPSVLIGKTAFPDTDNPMKAQSIPDEYILWNPGNEPTNNLPSPMSDISMTQPLWLPENKFEISKPTPADQSNQGDQLTNLAKSSEPKDVQPVGEVNRPNLKRASRAEDIAEGNSSIVERQRAFYKDHTYARQHKHHKKERQKQHLNEQQRQRQRDRKRAQQRDRKRELRKDPIYAELEREHKRQRIQNDPDFAERQRVHRRLFRKKSRLRRALKDSPKGVR